MAPQFSDTMDDERQRNAKILVFAESTALSPSVWGGITVCSGNAFSVACFLGSRSPTSFGSRLVKKYLIASLV